MFSLCGSAAVLWSTHGSRYCGHLSFQKHLRHPCWRSSFTALFLAAFQSCSRDCCKESLPLHSSKSNWSPQSTRAGVLRKDAVKMQSDCVVHAYLWPQRGGIQVKWCIVGHTAENSGYLDVLRYQCLGNFTSEKSVVELCFYNFSL